MHDPTRPHPARPDDPVVDPLPVDKLLVACGAGDEVAFESLFTIMRPRLLGLALRILRDRAHAEEVAQEALLSIWLSAPTFDPARGSAIAWMFTITHRRAVERVDSVSASTRRELHHATTQGEVPFDTTTEAALGGLESLRIRRLLDQLGPRHRTAVHLAFLCGLSHTEIADRLGLPLGTAKGHVRDGLRGMRQLIEAEAG